MENSVRLRFRGWSKRGTRGFVDLWFQKDTEYRSAIYRIDRNQLEDMYETVVELRRLLDNV